MLRALSFLYLIDYKMEGLQYGCQSFITGDFPSDRVIGFPVLVFTGSSFTNGLRILFALLQTDGIFSSPLRNENYKDYVKKVKGTIL